jgi:hypothetical protein
MSEIPTWPKISGALGTTTKEFGALDWANLISDYLNGVNIGLLDASKLPVIGSITKYQYEKLAIYDSDASHYIVFSPDDIDTGANRKIKIRRMNTPFLEDHMVLEGQPTELFNKTINVNNNFITATSQAAGDLLVSNGTKMVRKPVGTSGQLLKVSLSGTDVGWENDTTMNIYMDDIEDVVINAPPKRYQSMNFSGSDWQNMTTFPNIIYEKVGQWFGMLESPSHGYGLLANGLMSNGGIARKDSTVSGLQQVGIEFTSITASGVDVVGLKQTNSYYRRQYGSKYFAYFEASFSADARMFMGLATSSTDFSSDTPLGSGVGGILVIMKSTENGADTTFKVVHNDTSGSQVEINSGIEWDSNSNFHLIEIDLVGASQSALVYIDSILVATIATELPTDSTNLFPFWRYMRAAGADKSFSLYKAQVTSR